MQNRILQLAKKTQDYYAKHEHLSCIVKPSIPIMYFGDIEAYKKSKLKIITVGLNPSNIEFQKDAKSDYSFFRFPKWENQKDYIGALNSYFETGHSYTKWFDMGYEEVLSGLDASYYSTKGKPNMAIHTDLFTPIATNPNWTAKGFNKETKAKLQDEGIEIWKELVEILNPDIILTALSGNDRKHLELKNISDLIPVEFTENNEKRKWPYTIQKATYNNKYIVLAKTVNIPFGDISHKVKIEYGKTILSDYKKQNNI